MSSYGQDVPYSCDACGHTGARWTWLVVDAADQPSLIEEMRRGDLRSVACEHCGVQRPRQASLLVRSRRRSPPLFAADPAATAEVSRQQFMASVMTGYRGEQPAVIPDVLPISHDLMPLAAGRDVEDDLEAFSAGTFIADSAELQQYADWLSVVTRQRRQRSLDQAVQELIHTTDVEGFADVVRRQPALLGDDAEGLLGAFQQVVDADAPPQYGRQLEEWRYLLRLCRRDGVEETLARLTDR